MKHAVARHRHTFTGRSLYRWTRHAPMTSQAPLGPRAHCRCGEEIPRCRRACTHDSGRAAAANPARVMRGV